MAEPQPPPITFISIELCQECSKHKWCTRHDEKKYNDLFEEVKKEVQLLYPNVQVLKNREIKKPQIGAFEVKINDSTIFSKVKSGLFPVPAALAQRIKLYIDDYDAGRDISKYSSIREKKYSPPKKRTTEKEALIGVGMTGVGSGAAQKLDLKQAANIVKVENERVAKLLGINSAARCTTIKPSGTSSLTLGTSSGIHAWHNDYYIRRIRVGKNEAIYTHLSIHHPELVEDDYFRPHDTAIISAPQKAPEGSILRHESAIDLLERVKFFYQNWIKPGHRTGQNTHNISATVSIKADEWEVVGKI